MRRAMLTLAIAAALAAASPAAHAAPPARGTNDEAVQLDTVTVTSEYRAEAQQDVPLAVTAFSAETIADAGIESPADFVAMTPNISYDESYSIGNSFVTVRGMQQLNNGDAPMAVVVDGVPQSNQKQFKMELYDIERIEVLRGPQGALYGRNAIGGAINIVTRAPTEQFEGNVQVSAGNGGRLAARGSAGGSSEDGRLGYRLAASTESFDGLIRNRYTARRVDGFDGGDARLRLIFKPRDDLDLDLRLAGSRLQGGAVYDTSFDPRGRDNANRLQLPFSDTPGDSKRTTYDGSFKLDWRRDWGTFTAITGYTDLKENVYGDLDFCNPRDCPGGLAGFGQADQRQDQAIRLLSQELRLSSADDRPLRWTTGVYVLDTRRDVATQARLLDLGNLPIVDTRERNRNLAWAAFGQAEVDLGARTELTGSLRYDEDRRRQTDAATGAQRQATFGAWQPRLSLSHRLGETQSLYATYATGFRSGGFNGVGGRPFGPERLKGLELGYKAMYLDNRVQFNAAAFAQKVKDYQFFYVDLDAGGAQVIDNLAEVQMHGIEFETKWQVRRGLELGAYYGRLFTRIAAFDPGLTVPTRVGNKAPRTQDYDAGAYGQWNFGLGQLHGLFRVDVERRGPRTWMPDNVDVMQPFTLLNARIGLNGYRWSTTLWAKNLTNRYYYADFVPNTFSGLGRDVAFPTRGRTWGLDLRYDF